MDRLLNFLLIASTNIAVRLRIAGAMRAAGFAVLEASTSEELLRQSFAPLRAIVLEGELTGICSRLRREPELSGVSLLALSHNSVEGATLTLPPSIDLQELLRHLRECTNTPRTGLPSLVVNLFRGLISGLVSHVAILDTDGTILAVNEPWRAFAQRNGADPALLSEGANYLKVCENACGPEQAEAVSFANHLRQVMLGQLDSFTHEYPCHSSTELRWFTARVSRLVIGGQPYVMVSHENITDRKRVEAELEQTNQRITDILESIEDGFAAIDSDGKITYINRALERFLGEPGEHLLGQPILPLVPDPSRQQLRQQIENSPSNRKPLFCEQYLPSASCWVELHTCPTRDGLLLYVRDISELRRSREAEARNQSERLERLERETRELQSLIYRPLPKIEAGQFQKNAPELFQEWVQHYQEILDLALEQRAYRVVNQTTERLQVLAQRLGYAGAGPRDVIEVHTKALQVRTRSVLPGRLYAYVEESRLLLIELMGYLVLYYRGTGVTPGIATGEQV